jgi:POT family proton-dependent oligopeptide transporter
VALGRGGLPHEAGAPRDPGAIRRKIGGFLRADWAVYLGIVASIPLLALLVMRNYWAGWALSATGLCALGYLLYEACFQCTKIERERVFVALILMFFSVLFWAFFEQAGSSMNNFTDRNVDRVLEERTITEADVGSTLTLRVPLRADGSDDLAAMSLLSQEFLGYEHEGKPFTLDRLADLRAEAAKADAAPQARTLAWTVTEEQIGMGVGGAEIPASEFQAANPIYILIFGLLFSALWGFLGARGLEPSTPVKFALGLLQLGLAFGAVWYGARLADGRGMVAMSWLLLAYLLQTTGELCLSPVGLAMVTRLSPARIVSTIMGAWFLATAFSNYLAGRIASFTGVSEGVEGEQVIPPPSETVDLYGGVFGTIALCAIGSSVICLLMAPLLSRWMHPEAPDAESGKQAG